MTPMNMPNEPQYLLLGRESRRMRVFKRLFGMKDGVNLAGATTDLTIASDLLHLKAVQLHNILDRRFPIA